MATIPKISPERTKRQSLAFGRNLIVLALLVLLPGLWGATKGALTLRWPRTEAKIIDASLRTFERATSDPYYRDQWHAFSVHYRYSVGGKDYFGGGVEPYDFGMQNSAGAKKMKERHPIGSTAQVVYDPAHPEVAYLEPGPSSVSLVFIAIGVIIGFFGFWVRSLAKRGIGRMA
jgi:hypothetical protein